ncbi:MAG: hypothetical protein QW491_05910 [Thermoproteota archaeon]
MSSDREPQLINVNESDKAIYDRLTEKGGPLEDFDNKYVFLLAMALGYANNIKTELTKKTWLFRTSYLDENEKAMIKAVAIAEEGSLAALLDKEKIYSLAEQYAAGGIRLLGSIAFEKLGKDLYKKLLSELQAYRDISAR